MKKIALTFVILFGFINHQNLNAQASDKIFHSLGYTIEYSKLPYEYEDFNQRRRSGRQGLYGIGYNYNFRYSLANMGENSSLGLSAGVIAGIDLSVDEDNLGFLIGGMYLPTHLNFNFGAGSTYDTDKDFGFGLGLGVTSSYLPLFGNSAYKGFRVAPSARLAIRFWGSNTNALKEYFIRFDKLPGSAEVLPGDNSSAFTVMFGAVRYIGY